MAVLLDGIEPFLKAGEIQEGLVLKIINEYIFKLSNALNDFYSKCAFDISVKRFDKNSNTIYTIASTDRASSIMDNNIMDKPEENTEFNSILNEHYEYFFVSDIDDFDELIMPYKSSNANWKSFYRSSIVVPITKKQEPFSHIIGFICITSPQSLNNTTKNRKIISLLRATSNELYEILVKMPYSM